MLTITRNNSFRRALGGLPRLSRWSASLVAVTLLAALLRLWALGESTTNAFYDAAVRSMGQSWHNFLFAAFEPGGGVSIDKPPVDLWAQVLSVKLFGFGATSLILPQALAATIAVPVLYDLVKRLFGRPEGLAAALALAVMPISVITARSDTMDSLMMALNVLAAWLVVRSAESGRVRLLLLAGAVMGLNFEVKLFEALLALPALAVLYALASEGGYRWRLRSSAAALGILVAVALSWPVFVSLTPKSSRPYPIGSSNGSVWNAIFIYNGLDRFNPPRYGGAAIVPAVAITFLPVAGAAPASLSADGQAPGPLRLFALRGYHFGQNLGVELIGALAFGLVALFAHRRTILRRRGQTAEARAAQAGALALAVWLLVCIAVFSRTKGVLHPRYLEAMTPAVAAALGVGVVTSVRAGIRETRTLVVTVGALLITALYAVEVAGSDAPIRALTVIAAAVAGLALLATRVGRARALATLTAAVVVLAVPLVPALARSVRMVRIHASDAGGTGAESTRRVELLSSYLRKHNGGAYYELATYAYPQASRLVVHDGLPVLVLMSFHRPVVSVRALADQVRSGRLRYAVIEGHCGADRLSTIGDCPATIRWLRRRSVDVTAQAGLHERGVLFQIAHIPAAGG